MQLTSALGIVLSVASLTAALPTKRDTQTDPSDSPSLTYHVSDFSTGCSPGGCVYDFKVYGVESENTPAFNTTCSGKTTEKEYQPCKDPNIKSLLTPGVYPDWNIKVQHHWLTGPFDEHWTRGEKNITSMDKDFEIPVTKPFGVS